jgi:flagellar biosynthesis chaperone FliJ
MTFKEFNELKKKYFIFDDVESIFDFVSEVLYLRKKETEKNEPYAVNCIKRLENAEHEVYDLIGYVAELEENN